MALSYHLGMLVWSDFETFLQRISAEKLKKVWTHHSNKSSDQRYKDGNLEKTGGY